MSVPVVVAANGIGTPVKPVASGAPSMTVATNGYGSPIVISDLGTPFVVNGLIPEIVVTGGVITPFTSGGTDYIEIAFAASGSFTLSQPIATHNRALGAGGATGGRGTDASFYASAGGAGGLVEVLGAPLAAGSYTVSIGAGGAAVTTGFGRNNGSNSVLTRPDGVDTAIGGGGGASSGVGNTDGNPGGSGGGARGMNTAGTGVAGAGTPGQGFGGGLGFGAVDGPSGRASGGSGGANSAGGDASAGVPGSAGPGRLLSWLASPITVCAGERGITQADLNVSSADKTFGSGSRGATGSGSAGKGGDGFMFLVVRAADANVVMA